MPKDASEHNHYLTKESKEYLDELVEQQFTQQYESPIDPSLLPPKEERPQWTPNSVRCGLIGKKIGILPYWNKKGRRGLATLLLVPDNHVIKSYDIAKTAELAIHQNRWWSHGMAKMVVGAQSTDPRKFTKSYCELFKESGVMPKAKITTMLCTEDALIKPGTPLSINHFRVGDFVDVHGKTRDWGFQGAMRRWAFKGMPKLGTTKAHRRPGSIGRGRRESGPRKGKKMPGHEGSERRNAAGLEVLKIDNVNNVIFVKGPAVPGIIGSWVFIYDSKKRFK